MEMDSSSVSALHLLPDWKRRILEDHDNEGVRLAWPVKSLRGGGRRAVWIMCERLGVNANGVAARACRSLEIYLARQMHDSTTSILDNEGMAAFKRALAAKLPLVMACCIQLSAKMCTAGVELRPSFVRSALICVGSVYCLEDIISTEFEVFKTLGFCIPLWTSLDVAQLLALDAGLPRRIINELSFVVDTTERNRDNLNYHVIALAGLSPEISAIHRSWVRTLHMCAGAVVASARRYKFNGGDIVPQLATLTRAPISYISCLSDVILAHILIDDVTNKPPHTIKRKINDDSV